jgi:hypothetical protein
VQIAYGGNCALVGRVVGRSRHVRKWARPRASRPAVVFEPSCIFLPTSLGSRAVFPGALNLAPHDLMPTLSLALVFSRLDAAVVRVELFGRDGTHARLSATSYMRALSRYRRRSPIVPGRKLPPSKKTRRHAPAVAPESARPAGSRGQGRAARALSARNLIVAELERIDRGRFPRPGETFEPGEPER